MNAALPNLHLEEVESRRRFFTFVIKRFLLGTSISLAAAAAFLYSDVGGITSMMLRSNDGWLWMAFFTFDIWVTVTGITIAVGLWRLGKMTDAPPSDH